MQTRAIIEAAMNVKKTGIPVHVEIMVPLVGNHKELRYQKNIIDRRPRRSSPNVTTAWNTWSAR